MSSETPVKAELMPTEPEAIIRIETDPNVQIEQYRGKVTELRQRNEPLTITDELTRTAAADLLQEIKTELKKAELDREETKKPFLNGGRAVDRIFAMFAIDPLKKLKELVDGKLWTDHEARRKLAEAAQAAIEAEKPPEAAPTPGEPQPEAGLVPVKLGFEPQKKLETNNTTLTIGTIPDREKIQKAVNEGERAIPGCRIYPVWTFEIEEPKLVPSKYRRPSSRSRV